MSTRLHLENTPLTFVNGYPPALPGNPLPFGKIEHAAGPWGTICIQELDTGNLLLRHFLFLLNQTLAIHAKDTSTALQSIISLKGNLDYSIKGLKTVSLKEKEFHLFNTNTKPATALIPGGKLCSIINTCYLPSAYEEFMAFFPQFKKHLRKAAQKPFYFLHRPIHARYTVHDAIQAIWFDRYVHTLHKKHIELRLQTSLFSLLAQTYMPPVHDRINKQEREKAAAAKEIILQNIRTHLTVDQIAAQLYCSPPWLKKAFGKVYGVGLFHFLREYRMQHAREMLLRGESLKAVAIEVGMKPRNFPKEFKSFFGYTVTDLKKGLTNSP
jgi:AraC-like DNA-binding protein